MITEIKTGKFVALKLCCLLSAMALPVAMFGFSTAVTTHKDTAQTTFTVPVYNIEEVEVKPEYPGGVVKLLQFIKNKLKYPVEAAKKNIQGKVVVQFTVKADGKLDDIKVLNSVHALLDREAIRIVKAMPKWKPGEHEGKKVDVIFMLPVTFSLKNR
jgi:protein TonB